MAAAVMTLGAGPQRFGPALRRLRVPFGPLALSTIAHIVLIVGVVVGATIWRTAPTKTYVVNLVPAVAAVGVPRPEPVLPPRPNEPAAAPRELPPAHELPPVRDMPVRDLPSRSAALPDRTPTPALPRPGDKELPSVASAPKPAPVLPPPTAPARVEPPSSPPIGSPTGSPQGAGAVTLNVADFPYAWYIQAIHRKIQERWEGRAINGRQPEVIFVIGADGRLRGLEIGKSSGNAAYDQQALRAVSDANPFPPLPDGFGKSALKVGLQFVYDPRAR